MQRALRLTLFGLAVFYVIFTGGMILQNGLGAPVGADFRSFLASAQIAHDFGFARIYDIALQDQVQEALVSRYAKGRFEGVLPTFFLPVFILPFLAFLPLGFPLALGVWTFLNLLVFVRYIRRYTGDNLHHPLFWAGLLSFPVFANFFWGQANIWLLVCVEEFLRAWERGKYFSSGLWLGGLLLKPQTLILTLPGLVLAREWRILAGFVTSGLVISLASFGLAGREGLRAWLILPFGYTGESPAIVPEAMINFRALGVILSSLLPSGLAWGIAGGVGVLSAALSLWISFRAREGPKSTSFLSLVWLTATCTVAWHSYAHTAVFLLAPLVRQVLEGRIPLRVFVLWALLPPLAFALIGILVVPLLIALGWPPPPIPAIGYPALTLLGWNVYLIAREISLAFRVQMRKRG